MVQTNSSMSGSLDSSTINLFIGNQQNSSNEPVNSDSGRYFNGDISIVKIYDTALTETQIESSYSALRVRFNTPALTPTPTVTRTPTEP